MGQRTLIVGLGVTGLSCVRHLAGSDRLTVVDTRKQPPGLAEAMAAHPEVEYRIGACQGIRLSGFDRAVLSPGIGLQSPLAQSILASGLPLLSDIDLFCRSVKAPIYAVTGTNGKSTVTTLAGHLLAKLNRRPGIGGNIGRAALDVIHPDCDCYVLELSSFQLERMQAHRYQAATILNVSADHLDRHGGMDNYIQAKQRIYRRAERIIANRDDPHTRPCPAASGRLVTFGAGVADAGHWGLRQQRGVRWLSWGAHPLVEASRLPILGAHNECNALAALALVHEGQDGCDLQALGKAILDYRGLTHRCERVAVIDGVTYINDSKATNPGAALAALASQSDRPGATVLIAGGDGKDADFQALGNAIAKQARLLITIGQDGPRIARATGGRVPTLHTQGLADAVHRAAEAARPGDTVLFSPACASFDLFADFQERGEAFRALVQELRP